MNRLFRYYCEGRGVKGVWGGCQRYQVDGTHFPLRIRIKMIMNDDDYGGELGTQCFPHNCWQCAKMSANIAY